MIADILAGLLSGVLGAMGFGGGGILILYLTLYRGVPQLAAQGVNLIFFIPSAIAALLIHTKNKLVEWKTALKFILLGLVGVGLGYLIVRTIDENLIRKIFSSILIVVGLKELFSKNKK